MLGVFVMLFSVFIVIGEMPSLGKGSYNTIAMLIYVCSLIPNCAYMVMPLAVLIGVMVSMLSLVNYSEYAILRTSGISLWRITAILFVFGAVFSGATFLLGEVIVPEANHFAKVYKMSHTHDLISAQLRSGVWSRDGANDFVNIKQIMPDNTILGIRIFHYDSGFNLQTYTEATEGTFDLTNNQWILKDVRVKNYTKQDIMTTHIPQQVWITAIDPSYFNVLVTNPEEMSAFELIKYISHLSQNKQSTQRYEIAFWNKLLYPIACISMALLALAFTPNNRRNINLSTKLFYGILIGLVFYFTTKLVGYMALLYSWNAIVSNVGPTAILFFFGWYFVIRKE
jgi:lipopolysaccharide export system permease protein